MVTDREFNKDFLITSSSGSHYGGTADAGVMFQITEER